jgi:hypothetical protein
MGFSRENYRKIKREYEGKALRAQEAAENRKRELGIKFPTIKNLDDKLSLTGLRIYEASLRYKGERLDEALAAIKKENAAAFENIKTKVLAELAGEVRKKEQIGRYDLWPETRPEVQLSHTDSVRMKIEEGALWQALEKID